MAPTPFPDDPLAAELVEVVGPSHVLVDEGLKAPFETDWTRRFSGTARLVVRPASTDEVAATMRICSEQGVAVIPQGGNTGLVGGGIPRAGEVVLSLTRLNQLGEVDRLAGQVTVDAGVTLAAVQDHAAAAGLVYPVDLGARESATIGGTIATNAGGIRVLKYGSTRRQVLGIEAVMADGRILTRMNGLVKDNTGYDLAGLFTGSEGTLAIVTKARLRLVPRLSARVTALLAVQGIGAAQRVFARVRAGAASLEAAEVFTSTGLELVREHTTASAPFATSYPVYLLLECAAQTDPTEELAAVLAEDEEVLDVAVATDAPAQARLWALREWHTEAINAAGTPIKLDLSFPTASMEPFVDRLEATLAAVAPDASAIVFGHIGDGNLHVNVLGADTTTDDVDDAILRLVIELGGSISAEHGIGTAKLPWLPLYSDAVDLAVMGSIKAALDPQGLLNPGVLLPTPGGAGSAD